MTPTNTKSRLPWPFCGMQPIKFGNETTCECDNKSSPIYGVAIQVDEWNNRTPAGGGKEDG